MNHKRYTHYKPSNVDWLGDIPAHWEVRKLKYVATYKSGDAITSEDINEVGQYAVYGGNGLRGYTSNYNHDGTYILIGRQGALCGNINYATGKFWASEHAVVVYQNQHNTTWLGEVLRMANLNKLSQTAAQPGISITQIKDVKIPLPPLLEQTAIAAYLNRKLADIDTFIAKKQRLIILLQEQKAAMINKAVTKGLNEQEMRPSGIAWLGDIPTHWEVKKLRYVANCYPSNVDKHSKENEKQVRLCNYTDVYKNDFITNDMDLMLATATDEQIEKFTLRKNDVIITKDSETADDIAVPALVKEDLENVICGYHLSILRPYETLLGLYLMRALQCKVINIQFEVCAHGVTRVGLGVYDIRSAKIPLPPLTEQIAIVSHIEAESARIDKAIQLIERELTLVQEYRTALIAEAVTGKIDCTP